MTASRQRVEASVKTPQKTPQKTSGKRRESVGENVGENVGGSGHEEHEPNLCRCVSVLK